MKLIQKNISYISSFVSKLETKTDGYAIKPPDYFLAMFLSFYMLTRMISMPALIANLLAAMSGLACFGYVLFSRWKAPLRSCIAFGALLCVCLVASVFYNHNGSLSYVLWVWGFLGAALVIYTCPMNPKFILAQFYVFAAMIAFHALSGKSPKSFLAIGSENNISTYLILYLLVHLAARSGSKEPIALLPIITATLLTMWTGSRAGILALGILLVLAFVFNITKTAEKKRYLAYWRKLKSNKKLIIGVAVVALAAIVVVLTSDFFSRIVDKFLRYGGSSVRTRIWADYIKSSFDSFGNCFLGPNITNSSYHWLKEYPGNPHNAFLILHAHFGLVPFLLVVSGTVYAFILLLKKKNYLFIIVLITATVRSFFDWTAFPGPYDVIYYIGLLLVFDQLLEVKLGNGSTRAFATDCANPNIHPADVVRFTKQCITFCCTIICLLNVKKRGKNITVNYPCKFTSNTQIGNNCHFNGIEITGSGRCVIGDNFHSGKRIRVLTSFHNYEGGTALPYDNTYIHKDVIIGENVWIGQDVTILAGVTIGEGAVIQAGSVVCKDIPPLAIAIGNPAEASQFRNEAHYYALKKQQKN